MYLATPLPTIFFVFFIADPPPFISTLLRRHSCVQIAELVTPAGAPELNPCFGYQDTKKFFEIDMYIQWTQALCCLSPHDVQNIKIEMMHRNYMRKEKKEK